VPKLVRGIGTIERQPSSMQYIEKLPASLLNGEVNKYVDWLREFKEEVIFHAGNPVLAERFRFASDLFDIRALASFSGFNEDYLIEAFNSWHALKERTEKSRRLVSYLFPNVKF